MHFILLIGGFVLLFAAEARADAYEDMQLVILKNTESVEVIMEDDVRDNCWPSPAATKAKVEEKLLSAGIPIRESAEVNLIFSMIGYATNQKSGKQIGCDAAYHIRAEYYNDALTPNSMETSLTVVMFFKEYGMRSTGEHTLQPELNEAAVDAATKFVVLWLKSRQQQ